MKASIHLWAGQGLEELRMIGYTAPQEIEEKEVFDHAQAIFEIGKLNVMITHGKLSSNGEPHIFLWVDTKSFKQR